VACEERRDVKRNGGRQKRDTGSRGESEMREERDKATKKKSQ
jgi:hypothetical protein